VLNFIISLIPLTFLLGMIAYVLTLLANNSRLMAITQATVDLEAKLLKAKIDQVVNQQRLENEKKTSHWSGFRKFQVIDRVMETDDICSFYLAPHDGKRLPPFEPGQYLTFQVHPEGQPKPVTRCYSLSDSPNHPDRYRVSIKKVPPPPNEPMVPPGLVSNYFHNSLKVDDIIDVKAPSGHFHIDQTKQTPVVLLGSGVGITPVLSILNSIAESDSKRETWFFLGVKNRSEHMMKEHLEAVAKQHENIEVKICYSRPEASDVEGQDYHYGERVSVDLLKRVLPSNNYDYYLCGPPPMIKSLRTDLEAWGVPKAKVHFEAFGPATVKKNTDEKPATTEKTSTIQVTFARTSKTMTWNSAVSSILDFAEANGIPMESGCRAGNCGTCLVAIKSGEISYVGEPGSTPEAGSCLACISVPKSDLIVDA